MKYGGSHGGLHELPNGLPLEVDDGGIEGKNGSKGHEKSSGETWIHVGAVQVTTDVLAFDGNEMENHQREEAICRLTTFRGRMHGHMLTGPENDYQQNSNGNMQLRHLIFVPGPGEETKVLREKYNG